MSEDITRQQWTNVLALTSALLALITSHGSWSHRFLCDSNHFPKAPLQILLTYKFGDLAHSTLAHIQDTVADRLLSYCDKEIQLWPAGEQGLGRLLGPGLFTSELRGCFLSLLFSRTRFHLCLASASFPTCLGPFPLLSSHSLVRVMLVNCTLQNCPTWACLQSVTLEPFG